MEAVGNYSLTHDSLTNSLNSQITLLWLVTMIIMIKLFNKQTNNCYFITNYVAYMLTIEINYMKFCLVGLQTFINCIIL